MPDQTVQITCARCGHAWSQDLAALDAQTQVVIYRGATQPREYRVRCPRCGTKNVVIVALKEDSDG